MNVQTQTFFKFNVQLIINNINLLEGTAPYRHLLLAPAEGWWPSATWWARSHPHPPGKKITTNHLFKTPLWGTSKNL